MGVADIIPGVSGGTIALILGVYQQLIISLQSLGSQLLRSIISLKFNHFFSTQKSHISFLSVIFLGVMTSLIVASSFITYLFNHYKIYTYSFFAGLIIVSIAVLMTKIGGILNWKKIALIILGTMGGYILIQLVPVQTPNTIFFIIFSGFISITAMILPGISGSFILLILGKYEFFINVLKNPFIEDHWKTIFTFGIGAALGMISTTQILGKVLKNHSYFVICFLTGLMIGSFGKIWPWKRVVDSIVVRGKEIEIKAQNFFPEWNSQTALAFGIMFLGALLIILLEYIKYVKKDKGI